jgi:hypothetical protein
MAKAPNTYVQPKEVPMKQPPETDKPTFPSMSYLLPKPERKTMRGTGAATRGKTFGKNG